MLCGDIAAGPGPDLNDERLAQRGFEFLRDNLHDYQQIGALIAEGFNAGWISACPL